ncbi:MAG: ATP-binding cassette domain-containing protein [Termitinemataceae bacterium]
MSSLFELDTVSVSFAGYTILDQVSAIFNEQRLICIVGKAGSGKSTLLKTLAGLVVPDDGRVLFKGKDIHRFLWKEEHQFRGKSSFVFQDAALWANQNIYNNLYLPLVVHNQGISKTEADSRIKQVIQRLGYTEGLGSRPADLSMGEQKLISIARCLINNPDIMFMDEPTASLDVDAVKRLYTIFHEEKNAGKTIIVVTHDDDFIAEFADDICIIANGKIVAFDDAQKVAPLLGGDLVKKMRERRIHYDPFEDIRR